MTDAALNDLAIRSFRDIADVDHIAHTAWRTAGLSRLNGPSADDRSIG